jgi:hypothetical protein
VGTTGREAKLRRVGLAARCPRCQQQRGVQSLRKRGLQTRLGPIALKRWRDHCWPCGRGWSPPDPALELSPYQRTRTRNSSCTRKRAVRIAADPASVSASPLRAIHSLTRILSVGFCAIAPQRPNWSRPYSHRSQQRRTVVRVESTADSIWWLPSRPVWNACSTLMALCRESSMRSMPISSVRRSWNVSSCGGLPDRRRAGANVAFPRGRYALRSCRRTRMHRSGRHGGASRRGM